MSGSRRTFLAFAAGGISGVGVVLASQPFFRSLNPQSHHKPPFIDIKITKLQPGQMTVAAFQRKPIYVTRRTKEQIATLYSPTTNLTDPDSDHSKQPDFAKNRFRSHREDIFVAIGICTHLGCAPSHVSSDNVHLPDEVTGGYFCPCHGALYDAAGRVFKDGPAPRNLAVPDYKFIEEDTIRVSLW